MVARAFDRGGISAARTTAVIVNWDNFEDTLMCVESLRASSSRCQVVVVDNGSRASEAIGERTKDLRYTLNFHKAFQ